MNINKRLFNNLTDTNIYYEIVVQYVKHIYSYNLKKNMDLVTLKNTIVWIMRALVVGGGSTVVVKNIPKETENPEEKFENRLAFVRTTLGTAIGCVLLDLFLVQVIEFLLLGSAGTLLTSKKTAVDLAIEELMARHVNDSRTIKPLPTLIVGKRPVIEPNSPVLKIGELKSPFFIASVITNLMCLLIQ